MHAVQACPDEEPLITPALIRRRLTVGVAGYSAMLRQGLPCYRINRRVLRFRWSEVERWLSERRRGDEV